MIDQLTVEAAVADARLAAMEFDDAQAWLRAHQTLMEPLAAEVWVTDPAYSHVLLVRHRVRGWVPPGGKVEPGETPRAAAARELAEEAGIAGELLPVPAAVAVRSFRADWAPTLSLSAPQDREPVDPEPVRSRHRSACPKNSTSPTAMCAQRGTGSVAGGGVANSCRGGAACRRQGLRSRMRMGWPFHRSGAVVATTAPSGRSGVGSAV